MQKGHQKTRRASQGTIINKDAYVRVHVHIKRAPAFYSVDWRVRDTYTPKCNYLTQHDDMLA